MLSFPYGPTLTSIHDYWKTIALTRRTFVGKVMSLLFNMLSGFVIAFLPRSNSLLISWLNLPSAMIFKPKKIKSVTISIIYPFICHEVIELNVLIFFFWVLSFKPALSLSSFTFMKRLFSSSSLSAIRVVSCAYLRLLLFIGVVYYCLDFPGGSDCKASAYNAGDLGSVPGLGRSPGEWNGYPLQYSDLENSMGCIESQRVGHNWAIFTLHTLLLTMQTSFSLRMPLYFGRNAFMYTSNLHHTQC